jgi:predicted nucleic acid-binding protein
VKFLLDTNVISEWLKPQPDAKVVAWLADIDEDRVFLSVMSFAEIRHGVERMPAGGRRQRLSSWLAEELPVRFEQRVLGIDQRIAETWGILMARGRRVGANLGTMDAFFAATAEAHGLTLVTRNLRDFGALGISLLDPWAGSRGPS